MGIESYNPRTAPNPQQKDGNLQWRWLKRQDLSRTQKRRNMPRLKTTDVVGWKTKNSRKEKKKGLREARSSVISREKSHQQKKTKSVYWPTRKLRIKKRKRKHNPRRSKTAFANTPAMVCKKRKEGDHQGAIEGPVITTGYRRKRGDDGTASKTYGGARSGQKKNKSPIEKKKSNMRERSEIHGRPTGRGLIEGRKGDAAKLRDNRGAQKKGASKRKKNGETVISIRNFSKTSGDWQRNGKE